MKFLRALAYFFLALALFAFSAAKAKTINLARSDNGVLGAMKRGGCDKSALEPTLRLSGLKGKNLRKLPPNTPIVLPDDCESESKQALLAKINNLQEENRKIGIQLSTAQMTINTLNENHQIATSPKNPLTDLFTAKGWTLWLFTGMGYVIGLLVILWYRYWVSRRNVIAHKTRTLYGGLKTRSFTLDSVMYVCDECKQDGYAKEEYLIRKEHLKRHRDRKHPHDFIEVTRNGKKINPGVFGAEAETA